MKLSIHAKLHWQDRTYWLISDAPKRVSERPGHDRHLVTPCKEFPNQVHAYIRALDVPRHEYAVEFTEQIVIEVAESDDEHVWGTPPEPAPDFVQTPEGEYIPEEELSVSK